MPDPSARELEGSTDGRSQGAAIQRPELAGGRSLEASHPSQYANLAGVEVGDGFPTCLLGVINVSSESFYAASVARGRRALEKRATEMVRDGAVILDVGAMSTAPYLHGSVSEREERRRMVAAIEVLRDKVAVPICVDTQRSRVALAALEAGASIINDVSGMSYDPGMAAVAAHAQGLVVMAAETGPTSGAPLAVVTQLLRACGARVRAARISKSRVVFDPGIGFFRQGSLPWYKFDCVVLGGLSRLRRLGRPLLVGISRKSFVGRICGHADPAERLHGSVAAAAIAVLNGAALVRTHDIAATRDAVRMAEAIRSELR